MTEDYRLRMLSEAERDRDQARAKMNAAPHGSKAWREAADELDWLIGRVAFLSVEIICRGECGTHSHDAIHTADGLVAL